MDLYVQLLSEFAQYPTKNYDDDAGFDLYAAEDVEIYPGEVVKVKTDIAIAIPNGYFGLIRDRSSLGSKGIIVTAGVIDCLYRGGILVCLGNINFTSPEDGKTFIRQLDIVNNKYVVRRGDKIAQLLVLPVPDIKICEANYLVETERGDKGFGSSGK